MESEQSRKQQDISTLVCHNKGSMFPQLTDDGEKWRYLSVEERWKIIFNQQTRAPIYTVLHYVDHLKRQMSMATLARTAAVSKAPQIKDGISPLSYLLRKLKLDLKMSYDSFIDEFVSSPHDGITLLVSMLRDIQQFQQSGTTTRRTKLDQYKRSLTDEHDCLLCIKFSLRVQGAIDQLLEIRYGLETITSCLLSSFSKARVTALEILTVSLSVPEGYNRVLDSMTYIRLKFGESVRFKLLVSMLNSQGSVYVLFQLVCMRFLNGLMTCTGGQNARVFLQYELEMAGLDMAQLEKNAIGDGLEYDDLRREIETWKKRYVDVQGLQDELVALQDKCSLLRHQVDSKEDRVKALEDVQTELETQVAQLRESCDSYIAQNTTLQDSLEKMKAMCKKRGGKEVVNQEQTIVTSEPQTSQKKENSQIVKSLSLNSDSTSDSQSSDNYIIPVIPPPPPAPPLFVESSKPKRMLSVQPNVRLPLLNWQKLPSVENTVFQAMDEDQLYKEINLNEFEKKFKLKSVDSTPSSSPTNSKKSHSRHNESLNLLGADRMRNLVITKRKIGLTGPEVREYVDQFNLERLSGDYAELLLRFLPTKEELKLLSKHSAEFSKLGEAEQFLYHLGKINDCKTKLTIIAFIGAFDDVRKSLSAQITAIHKASVSILSSWKLRKIFQLILVLGNYLNCQRRGVAAGFKLESLAMLTEVKTSDRRHTFLHYLTDLLDTQYPSLVDWTEDLDINVQRSASYQSVLIDMKNLKRGMTQVHLEMEKLPDMKTLQDFYQRASNELDTVSENFSQMEEFYERACSTYGEKHTNIEPGEFFGYFSRFLKSYQKALVDNQKSSGNSSVASSPIHGFSPSDYRTPRQDFMAEAKLLIEKNSHRLASGRTLENGFSEMVKRKKAGPAALPSPIPTLANAGQAKVKQAKPEPYGIDLQSVPMKKDVSSKEIVNNWILQNNKTDELRDCSVEDKFRTSTLKSTAGTERLPIPGPPLHPSGDDHISGTPGSPNTSDPQRREPTPDYTNPNSPANTISNASEISRVLREFEGNIHTYLTENNSTTKEPVPARPVDFYRPVTYL